MNKELIVTVEGLMKLESELENHKISRGEVAERIKVAREFGDISENAEYDEAKNEQAFLEGEIAKIEKQLKNVRVVDEDEVSTDTVSVGCWVKVREMKKDGKTFENPEVYHIVGSVEADPFKNKISNESPVGSSLMYRKVGEIVDVQLPYGATKLELLEISKQEIGKQG